MGGRVSGLKRQMVGGGTGGRLKCMKGTLTTPRGYVPIAVGVNIEDTKTFMVHREALADANFMEMLRRSAEEYGFKNEGVLRIPYEVKAFEECMESKGFTPNSKMLKIWDPHSDNLTERSKQGKRSG